MVFRLGVSDPFSHRRGSPLLWRVVGHRLGARVGVVDWTEAVSWGTMEKAMARLGVELAIVGRSMVGKGARCLKGWHPQ